MRKCLGFASTQVSLRGWESLRQILPQEKELEEGEAGSYEKSIAKKRLPPSRASGWKPRWW